ncbi:hypothetical protein Agabi119p4_3060 [Agaricus bisporus var. burnettii]|uniref:ABC transporter domain-containing protein n=1 Tax=Agaricus bisporus var. burnettii TaxID=192524 RepID=A0A8H7KIJ4_AGABI|nr:hypothetical protein Agabi119p4_3060 [Agaricus bisporus var. burnettii]
MGEPILELHGITCEVSPGQCLFENVSFAVNEGDIVVLQGKSGSGKTTLLKCMAFLVLHKGKILYRGRTPQAHGRDKSTRESEGDGLSPFPTISIPTFRTRVLYVPQRPSLLPGTPRDFLYSVSQLKSHQASYTVIDEDSENDELSDVFERAIEVAGKWGVHAILWEREWSNLSGGEAQRIVLATALSLDTAEVLLLDEPTSALDPQSSAMVEEFLIQSVKSKERNLKALIWITHSEEQAKRVGTRFFNFSNGRCEEDISLA